MSDEVTRLVKIDEVVSMCGGISRSTINRMMAAGAFPTPIVLSRNVTGKPARVAWIYEELLAWINARVRDHRANCAK